MLITFDDKFQRIWSYLGQYAYINIHLYTSKFYPVIKIQRKFPPCHIIPTCTVMWNVIVYPYDFVYTNTPHTDGHKSKFDHKEFD